MDTVLAGQLRHVMTATGGAVAGAAVVAESLEAIIGGIVLALLGHVWSWLAKRER